MRVASSSSEYFDQRTPIRATPVNFMRVRACNCQQLVDVLLVAGEREVAIRCPLLLTVECTNQAATFVPLAYRTLWLTHASVNGSNCWGSELALKI